MPPTKRVYDTMVWLRKIKNAGITQFKHADLAVHGLTNKPCLMQAARSGFIKQLSKDKSNRCITWEIDEKGIMASTKRKIYFGDSV
jgi:hypothetical protein